VVDFINYLQQMVFGYRL